MIMAAKVSMALLHYPVYDRARTIVTTSVTSVDIHDLARTARTYGVSPFYVVTPISAQREMVKRIQQHWMGDELSSHPRAEALRVLRTADSLYSVCLEIARETGERPTICVTGASLQERLTSFADLRRAIYEGPLRTALLVFGTGWGLARELIEQADVRLEPIRGVDEYNHLPVRAAVAIVLDRLLGPR